MKTKIASQQLLSWLVVQNQSVLQAKRAWRMNAYASAEEIFYEKIICDFSEWYKWWSSYYLPLTCFDKLCDERLLTYEPKWLDPKPLKPEQIEIMELIKQEMTISNCCTISAVTWFGKTRIMTEIIRYNKWKKMLILVPTLILLKQSSKALKEYWIEHSIYWWDSKVISEVTIMSMQWLRNMSDEAIEKLWFEMVFIDECHKFLWEETRHALLYLQASTMYSFSATPYTACYNQKDSEKFFWKCISAWKFNMIPDVFVVEYENSYADFNPEEYTKIRFELVDPDEKRLQVQYTAIENLYKNYLRENIVVLYDRVEHTKLWYEFFKKNHPDIPVYYLFWALKEDERDEMIKWFTKTGWVLFASDAIAWVWFDVPAIDTACLFFPNKFDWRIIQMVWRALRASKWKYNAWLVDFKETIFDYQYHKRKQTYKQVYKKDVQFLKNYARDDLLESIFNF